MKTWKEGDIIHDILITKNYRAVNVGSNEKLLLKFLNNYIVRMTICMGKIKEYADEFEKLSKSIVEYLLRDTDVEISQTTPKKDGGYDIIVKCRDGNSWKCALFECKMRKGNLNLRDIAANVIIAFNHGAVAFVAITNYDFTQQLGEELLDFCQHTVLNVKIIIGEELQHILQESSIDITDDLFKFIDIKKTIRKGNFNALRINLDKNIIDQIFPSKEKYNIESPTLIKHIFTDEISNIISALQKEKLIAVTGYLGVGKHQIIQESLIEMNKCFITIDATLHETKDLIVLDILSQIWGLSTIKTFSLFSQNDIQAITEMVGDQYNEKETVELLTALLNSSYADKHISARNNVLLCNYIINILTLHKKDIGFVIYIKKLQFATQEIYDFLIYFIKYLVNNGIGCIFSYDNPEYVLQEGRNPLEQLCHIEQYIECHINLLEQKDAFIYIKKMYPKLSNYVIDMILSKIGTRLYNLSYLLKSLFTDSKMIFVDGSEIIKKLQFYTPNNIPNLLSQSLTNYKNIYPQLFEICYLFECRVPIELCNYIDNLSQSLETLKDVGVFCCKQGIFIAQNEFVQDWIMHAYSNNSPSIQMAALKLLNSTQKITYNPGYINMYRVLGRNQEALSLLEKNLNMLKREKQYTLLRKGLFQAIEISQVSHDHISEVKYLIEILEIITIQKEITTDNAEEYLTRLEYFSKCKILSEKEEYALLFFKLKREFKLGKYTKTTSTTIETAKKYYEGCINKSLTENIGDWLGRICSCYALIVKSIQGNEAALKIFKDALKIFPNSFELRREYLSHIACMQLFEEPLKAFKNYQQILSLFEEEAPDSAALPFHEYGDLAMSQLVAQNLSSAYLLANDAIEIACANGLLDEEGRCLNIRGCIEWCQGSLALAESSFHEAITIMQHSGYTHYLWRSQLNILQLSLVTQNYSDERVTILKKMYTNFYNLLAPKIKSLVKSDAQIFRKTVEYHALLILGVLCDKIANNSKQHLKICKDFELGEHKELYKKDVQSFLSQNYNFIKSPYIQNGYIFFVG